ncbi:MAG TPA: helix-turn-helix transcriptional regulator [Thermoanaerobaculia bacterium]|jgi:transcriptional regulator with XRE-family HTH domain|nr:helix-turn-helix transcriptional regulator [Thermoanaerobaculia bacterium]
MSTAKYSEMLANVARSVDYWQDIAQTDFARDMHRRMKEMGISAAELARRMGTSKAYVSQLMDGGNFTLLTMVKVAMALGAVVRVQLEGQEERAQATKDSKAGDLSHRDEPEDWDEQAPRTRKAS